MATFAHYHNFKLALGKKEHDMENDEFYVALLTSSYTPDMAAHDAYADLTNELSTDNGYVSGGLLLDNQSWTLSGGAITFDADDSVWNAVGGIIGPVRYGAIYNFTHASKLLVGLLDFGADKSAGAGAEFKIQHPATGIFKLT